MEDRKMIKKELAQLSFALDDLRLFLDTHPDCLEALKNYNELRCRRDEVIKKYEACIGPVNFYNAGGTTAWNWVQQPWPWEREV